MANATKPTDARSIRPEWLDRRREDILEPELPIIDTHHHMREGAGQRYMFEELLADVNSGHKVVATIFMQSGTKTRGMYRADGDPDFAPVGETEFANGIAAMSASGGYGPARLCAGIIGAADMSAGPRLRPVLEAHIRAGGDRFRGIRDSLTWELGRVVSAEPSNTARRFWRAPRCARAWPALRRSACRSRCGCTTRK